MASHKLITIIGIHADTQFLNVTEDEANLMYDEVTKNPDFVAAALYRGGFKAPLSGQPFFLIRLDHSKTHLKR